MLSQTRDELREYFVLDDVLRKVGRVVGESAEGEGGRLLDGGHRVEEERAQQHHHPRPAHNLIEITEEIEMKKEEAKKMMRIWSDRER